MPRLEPLMLNGASRARRSVERLQISNTFRLAVVIEGATALLNR